MGDNKMQRLTKEQAAIIGLFSGITAGPFSDIHELAERLMGRPIWTHEFAQAELMERLKEKVRPLFMEIAFKEPTP